MCLASQNNHPTCQASSWDISFLKSLVQQDPKGSNKVAHHLILDVYVSPNRKYVNLSIIYYIADFSFFHVPRWHLFPYSPEWPRSIQWMDNGPSWHTPTNPSALTLHSWKELTYFRKANLGLRVSTILHFCIRMLSHTSQEHACTRITQLFGWFVVTMPKMA